MSKTISKKIHNHLINSNKILVTTHLDPDGDALGSLTAIVEYLKNHDKEVVVFSDSVFDNRWHFLANTELIENDSKLFADDIDTVIVLDTGELKRAGIEEHVKNTNATIVNIDHHHTNTKFGEMNLVKTKASSTCEIVYYFLRHNGIQLNKSIATSLLTGIITDTDNFSNGATTISAMSVAGELLSHGGNLSLINNKTTKNKSVKTLKLWGEALSRLTKHEKVDLTYTYITQKDLKKHNVNEKETDGISNFLNNLDGSKVALMLKETEDGKIKGSFRTTFDDVDVSKMAQGLGGGGHKKAAGFTTEGKIPEVVEKIAKLYNK